MNRNTLFALGIAVAIICIIIAIAYVLGASPLGHHIKHAILFFAIAVIAFLFAMANRSLPTSP